MGSLTLEQEAEVGGLMVKYLDADAEGTPVSDEDILAECASPETRADLEKRLVDCRALIALRGIIAEVAGSQDSASGGSE